MYKKFLIVKLSSIGDVINAMPIARALKEEYESAKVSWLVSPPTDEILKFSPDIDEIILWDRRPFDEAVKNGNFFLAFKLLRDAKKLFSKYEFDVILDVHSLFLTGILSRMIKAKERFGIEELHEGNSFFMTKTVKNIVEIHKAKRYFSVLNLLNINPKFQKPNINFDENLIKKAEDFLAKNNVDLSKKILAINIKTTWGNKHYPFDSFVEVIKNIDENVEIIFTGTKGDISVIESVQKKSERGISIAGKTDISDLFYIFKRIDLLLTVDSGPLHIAGLAGLKTVSLWGPTSPKMYAPLFGDNRFIVSPYSCAACNKRKCKKGDNLCIRAIEPKIVVDEVNRAMKEF